MQRKTLHMIGHSHIDPVWFWTREEGMQEVRATIASALDRMDEFPDFCFTCTSPAFFAFLQRAQPEMIDRIRQRVLEGRFELAGGWWVEPDCNLPTGESFVRQGLYGQRLYQRLFGRMARIGLNPDSFGHSPMLPQILKEMGLEGYVFMRPSLTRPKNRVFVKDAKPVFRWRSPDGTELPAISLPAEYTCWFDESTQENIDLTVSQLDGYPSLPCFFGVGNHGGGPTIANIQSIERRKDAVPGVALRLSTLQAFFDEVDPAALPVYDVYFEHINTGCYSIDHLFKRQMRQAEQGLLRAERLASMAQLLGCSLPGEEHSQLSILWQRLLFNQFHDTLGGTVIREARDNAMADLGGVTAEAAELAQLAVQRISGRVDTRGDGHALLLVNDSPVPWDGIVDAELNWFCNDPLRLTDEDGTEIPYQRAKQACTMMWYRLGGRRRVLFQASLPPYGVRVLRAHAQAPQSDPTPSHEDGPPVLENEHLIATWDAAGRLCSLVDKHTGHEALSGGVYPQVWTDEHDSWGGGPGAYAPLPEEAVLEELRVTERGPVRQTLRVRCRVGTCRMTLVYTLDAGSDALRLDLHLVWDGPWQQLKLCLPVAGAERTAAEAPYCVMDRTAADEESFMHRYVDFTDAQGRGLSVVNDGIYAFSTHGDVLRLTLLRSAIYSQGTCVGWQNEHDTYEYTDLGEHRFAFLLSPHGTPRKPHVLAAMADGLSSPLIFLQDCAHPGTLSPVTGGKALLSIDAPNVRLGALKRQEDGGGLVLRLYETDGAAAAATVTILDVPYAVTLRPWQIATYRYDGSTLIPTDLLERPYDA